MRTALVALILCVGVAHAQPALLDQASALHKQAQKDHDVAKYQRAHELYQQYLARNPDTSDATTAFYDAELLFHLQRYDEAAKMYDRVITTAPKGKFADEAAYAFVISTKNAARPTDQPDRKPPCPDMKPCPIPADLQRLIGAFERYMAITNKERPVMEYRRARIYYEYQHFAEAAQQFDHVFTSYPDSSSRPIRRTSRWTASRFSSASTICARSSSASRRARR
jgi:tetratricopeptide (TPR) repeat protein